MEPNKTTSLKTESPKISTLSLKHQLYKLLYQAYISQVNILFLESLGKLSKSQTLMQNTYMLGEHLMGPVLNSTGKVFNGGIRDLEFNLRLH